MRNIWLSLLVVCLPTFSLLKGQCPAGCSVPQYPGGGGLQPNKTYLLLLSYPASYENLNTGLTAAVSAWGQLDYGTTVTKFSLQTGDPGCFVDMWTGDCPLFRPPLPPLSSSLVITAGTQSSVK